MSATQRVLARAIVLALLLCTVAAFVRVRDAHAQGGVTISFWHAMRGSKEAALKELIAEFEKANPGVRVEARFVGSSNAQWGNDYNALYRGLLENLATHTPPDVSQVYENWTTQLIDYGYIVPVQDYFASADAFGPADVRDLVGVFRTANTYGGKIWTLPFNKSIYVVYYNADTLKRAGVAPPKTWEALRAAAEKLTSPDRSVYGIAIQPNVDTLGHYLYAYGGEFVDDNKAVFNSNAGAGSMRFWVDLVNSDRTAFPSIDPVDEFTAGKAAMYVYTTSSYSRVCKDARFKVRLTAIPSASGRSPRVQLAGTNLAIFKTTPQRQAAAWKFIRYLSSRPVNTRWALRTGYLPVRMSAIKSPEFQAWLSRNPDYRDAAVANLAHACVQPKVSAWESIRGIVDDAMLDVISRRATPQESLDRAVAQANDLIRKILGGADTPR